MTMLRKVLKAARILQMPFARFALLSHSVAATIEHFPVLRLTRPSYVVDVGANRGQFSIAVVSVVPEAKIIAFEPLSQAAKIYSRIFHQSDKVVLHRFAIGESSVVMDINISNRDDSSSLLPIGQNQTNLFTGTQSAGTERVNVAPLAQFLLKDEIVPGALMKIDVQGFEMAVLRGASALLDRFDHIYVECSFIELYVGQARMSDVNEFLIERGFCLRGAYNVCYDPSGYCIQGDFLFSHKRVTHA